MACSWSHISASGAAVLLSLLTLAGCMTPEKAMRQTERIGNELASSYRGQVAGVTNAFTVRRPSDRLRARLMLDQGLPGLVSSNLTPRSLPDPLVLALPDALAAGALNDSRYQELKESVFAAALELDLQRHAFENTFEGLLKGGVERDDAVAAEAVSKATGNAKASASRKLAGGAKLTAALGLDVLRMLTSEHPSALGLLGDATVSVPLLRGAGRAVTLEPLTQAERDLLYALHDFEAYRQDYAVKIAGAYYGLLESAQQVQ
ncbi:MAG: hypothetical protein PHR35_12580, partial [Kiritimatiellae bacterium]|nr:hypothetical protein [Kiritimatiellia bacterium]